jgi:MSHA biogenesis protein MshO
LNRAARQPQRGFTLIELIMVIVIMGVIGGMVSVFMKSPIDAYFDSARRAALTDVADTVARRVARDIQRALPNSINTSGDNKCVEFIPTRTGGRYRAADVGALNYVAPGTQLANLTPGSKSFNIFGDFTATNTALPADQQIKPLDAIVLYNLGIAGVDGLDAYSGTNTASVTAVSAATGTPPETPLTVTFPGTVNASFPFLNTTNRLQVVPKEENVVAYVCSNSNLYRVVGTTLAHICPAAVSSTSPSVTGASVVATNVTCSFNYSGPDLLRNALITTVLTLADTASGEAVTLQHEVHVSNTP